ncbi:MAG TPA: asparagine synthase C-terminal domain-containing protein [Gaiellaceae bacterium]|nr:asparagine synthase C-terminal domain-containing protein [Gaiellaceae bacterium]
MRHALERAVERSLGDARCVGVMAGGGLDSAGLLALALEWARPRGAEVFAVALDFAARGDDRPYLRLLERRLGCEVIRVRPEEGAPHLAWTSGVDAAPFCWLTGPMEAEMMIRARERGAECVLMGVGGDELFDGEPQALARVARRGHVVTAIRRARSLRGFFAPRSRTLSWIVRPLVGGVTPRAIRMRLARRTRPWLPAWAGPVLRRYLEDLRSRDLDALDQNLARGVVVDPAQLERNRANNAWLRHQEQIIAGIERLDPFLDRELIATVAGFEPDWLITGGIRRGLFREALRDLLPGELLEREDKAYFEPAFVAVTNAPAGLEGMRELADARELAALGIVEPRPFREAFDAFVAAPDEGPPWMTIWPALCVERFLRAERRRTAT